ncbi:hypothetical protein BKA82DRAFT_623064 [Pisolithus tinctorius]|uniref:Uncharacterized protein n=1 Tax=Pisolithus tinctorius Marx 270 TaxID=870435 RepID=A0A0C3J353_PISTI|nr:hypothetical protein BKA82DRAFT_623064 [Pisolithus tinctorius]KIO03508.1 hypothetical protein M404DRAFT_623064 [Pisolithus tinctorius Marx 270]
MFLSSIRSVSSAYRSISWAGRSLAFLGIKTKAVSKSNLPRCSWVLAVLVSRKNLLHCLSVLFQILIAYPIKSTLCINQNHSDELTTTYLSFHFPSVLSLWASHDSAFFPRMYGHSHNWPIVLMVTSVPPPPLPSSLSYTRSVPFYSTPFPFPYTAVT